MCSSNEIGVVVMQAPYNLRKAFESELLEASKEASALVRELGRNIDIMQQPNIPKLVLQKVHSSAERLQSKIEEQSYLLRNFKPGIIISLELSHDSPLDNPLSSPNNQNDVESNCETAMKKPIEFHDSEEDEEGGEVEGGVDKTRASEIASALALWTFASLLMEFMARLDHLVGAVYDLGMLAKFKDKDCIEKVVKQRKEASNYQSTNNDE